MLSTKNTVLTAPRYSADGDPRSRARELFEGERDFLDKVSDFNKNVYTFGHANPWRRVWRVRADALTFPLTLEIKLADPVDMFDSEQLGIAWDDATAREMGPIGVREGETITLGPVLEPRGEWLEIWATDDLIDTPPRALSPREAELRQNTREAEQKKDDDGPSWFDKWLGVQQTTGIVLAVGAAVAIGVAIYIKT